MSYTAKTAPQFRNEKGTMSEKIASELGLIQSALDAAGITGNEVLCVLPMSFETGEQTTTRIYFPYKVTINKIRTIVMKALGATDTGTVTCGNSTGASTGGVVTIAISEALNAEDVATPSTNNVVLADGYYYLTTAKSTAGGKILVSLEGTRTA